MNTTKAAGGKSITNMATKKASGVVRRFNTGTEERKSCTEKVPKPAKATVSTKTGKAASGTKPAGAGCGLSISTYLTGKGTNGRDAPFRRIRKRSLKRQAKSEEEEERHVQSILHELEKLGSNPFDWTPFSPTKGGVWLRKTTDSKLHTALRAQGFPGTASMNGSGSIRPRSASATPSRGRSCHHSGRSPDNSSVERTKLAAKLTHTRSSSEPRARAGARSPERWSPRRDPFPRQGESPGRLPAHDTYSFLHPHNSSQESNSSQGKRGRSRSGSRGRDRDRSRSRSRTPGRDAGPATSSTYLKSPTSPGMRLRANTWSHVSFALDSPTKSVAQSVPYYSSPRSQGQRNLAMTSPTRSPARGNAFDFEYHFPHPTSVTNDEDTALNFNTASTSSSMIVRSLKSEKIQHNARFHRRKLRDRLRRVHYQAQQGGTNCFYECQRLAEEASRQQHQQQETTDMQSVEEEKGGLKPAPQHIDKEPLIMGVEHLVRGALKFLRHLYLASKVRHEPEIIQRVHYRNAVLDALAIMHMNAYNSRRQALLILSARIRHSWRAFAGRFYASVVKKHTYGRSFHRAELYYFNVKCRFAWRALRYLALQRRRAMRLQRFSDGAMTVYYIQRSLRHFVDFVSIQRNTVNFLPKGILRPFKSNAMTIWRGFVQARHKEERGRFLRKQIAEKGKRNNVFAIYAIPTWIEYTVRSVRMNQIAPQHAIKTAKTNALQQVRTYRDTKPADDQADKYSARRRSQDAILFMVAWTIGKRHRDNVLRKAPWVRVRFIAKSAIGRISRRTSNTRRLRLDASISEHAWGQKAAREALRTMLYRARERQAWRPQRRTGMARALEHCTRATGGSRLLKGRAVLRAFLKRWMHFMFDVIKHEEVKAYQRRKIYRHSMGIAMRKLHAKSTRIKFDHSQGYYLTMWPNRFSRLLERRVIARLIHIRSVQQHSVMREVRKTQALRRFKKKRLLQNWHAEHTERVVERYQRYEQADDMRLARGWLVWLDQVETMRKERETMKKMKVIADKKRRLHLAHLVYNGLIRNHTDLADEEVIANAFHNGKMMRICMKHARASGKRMRMMSRLRLKAELYCLAGGLAVWRESFIKVTKARHMIKTSFKHTKKAKSALLGKVSKKSSEWCKRYLRNMRYYAMDSIEGKRMSEEAEKHIKKWYVHRAITQFIMNTEKEVKDTLVNEHRKSAWRFTLMARAVRRFKDIAPNQGLIRTCSRRTVQLKLLAQALRWRPEYLQWNSLWMLRNNVKLRKKRIKRMKKYILLQNRNKLHIAWSHWRKERRLLKNENVVARKMLRKVVDLWTVKIFNRILMKKVVNSMVQGHHFRCFTSAFNEWRYDMLTERTLEHKLKEKKADKATIVVAKLLIRMKQKRKRTVKMEKSRLFHLSNVFRRTVYDILCAKIEHRRQRHNFYDEMYQHYYRARCREVLMNLLVFQKVQRALHFRQIKVYDEFMFNLKRIVNITRYHKALMAVGTSMLRRKVFHSFRRSVRRAHYHRKVSETAARMEHKAVQLCYFSTVATIQTALDWCDEWKEKFSKQKVCTVFFRYQRWRVLSRTEMSECDEHYTNRRLRVALHKLISHRSGLVEGRKTFKIVQRARMAHSLERAMLKLHLRAFVRWSVEQKKRLVDARMHHFHMHRGMQAMDPGPDTVFRRVANCQLVR